jgi:hypothetical protein
MTTENENIDQARRDLVGDPGDEDPSVGVGRKEKGIAETKVAGDQCHVRSDRVLEDDCVRSTPQSDVSNVLRIPAGAHTPWQPP